MGEIILFKRVHFLIRRRSLAMDKFELELELRCDPSKLVAALDLPFRRKIQIVECIGSLAGEF